MKILSKHNKSYKLWLKLKQKKHRDENDLFLVFGEHLIEKAKAHDVVIDLITANEDKEGIILPDELFAKLQMTQTVIDQIAVCRKTNLKIASNHILMLDDIQDPDNMGGLIRSAVAFGFRHLIISLKSADVYNEKVVRASQGAIFDIYIERIPLDKAIETLKNQGYYFLYADAHNNVNSSVPAKLVLVLGNEGQGVSQEIKDLCDEAIHIATQNVESLNVGVAGGILMHGLSKI